MAFATANFTGAAFTELSVVDSNFVKHPSYPQDLILGSTGAYLICNSGLAIGVYYHTATPPSADYPVKATIATLAGVTSDGSLAVCGRMSTTLDTYYFLQYNHASNILRLFERVAGVNTQLGSNFSYTLTSTPAEIELVMVGNQISGKLNGTTVIPAQTSNAITAAGKCGIRLFDTRQSGVNDAFSYDDFSAGSGVISYSIALESGTYTLLGTDATFGYIIVLESGTYTVSGRAVNIVPSVVPSAGTKPNSLSISRRIGI